jgi:hypothetical protein
MRLLSPFVSLPLRQLPPTAPVAVRYRSRLLRYANGNIFVALELALERPARIRSSVPSDAIRLSVSWRGPRASRLPSKLFLTPAGVYRSRRLFPLQRGPLVLPGRESPGRLSLADRSDQPHLPLTPPRAIPF